MGVGSGLLGSLRRSQVDAASGSDRLADATVGDHLWWLVFQLGLVPGPVAQSLDVHVGEFVADCAFDRKLLAEGVVGIVEPVRSPLNCQGGKPRSHVEQVLESAAPPPLLQLPDRVRGGRRLLWSVSCSHGWWPFGRWAKKIRKLGIEQVVDLHANDHGVRDYQGLRIVAGWPHCPAMSDGLIDIRRPIKLALPDGTAEMRRPRSTSSPDLNLNLDLDQRLELRS